MTDQRGPMTYRLTGDEVLTRIRELTEARKRQLAERPEPELAVGAEQVPYDFSNHPWDDWRH